MSQVCRAAADRSCMAALEVALESKMKIGKPPEMAAVPTAPAAPQAAAAQAGGRAAAPASDRSRASEPGASVTVSVRASALVQANVMAGSDIDMNRVEAVRLAIQQGTFKMNPEVIADKLLANAKEMLGRSLKG